MPAFAIWPATAGATCKDAAHNQDRVARFTTAGGAGVVVCDGVGAYAGSGATAERVTGLAIRHIETSASGLGEAVLTCAEQTARALGAVDDGATTLIAVGAGEDGELTYTFVGNGTLLDVYPVSLVEGRLQLRCAELVVPHISWARGRPALRAFLPAVNGEVETSAGTLRPHPGLVRLALALTDGIASDEERAVGVTPSGNWREIPGPLATLLGRLAEDWPAILGAEDPGVALAASMQAALDALAADGRLEDDATAGAVLLIPTPAAPCR
jgi:hypothetical protein